MKLKMAVDHEDELQVKTLELLKTKFENQGELEELTSWSQASEIEKTRWHQAGEAVGARVRGGMYDLVEHLISDRAFARQPGVYFEPGAEDGELVYAARRLLQAGQKVVLLDWDVARSAGEELLSSEIPVIDISQGGDNDQDDQGNWGPGGRAEFVVHQGADDLDWTMTVERAGELMRQLEGVEVIVFLVGPGSALEGDHSSQVQVTMDTLAMSARSIGRTAGAWGASILVGAGGAGTVSSPELWSKTLEVLVYELEMMTMELNR